MKENKVRYWKIMFVITLIGLLISVGLLDYRSYQRNKLIEENNNLKYELRTFNWDNHSLSFRYDCNGKIGYWYLDSYGDFYNAKKILLRLNCSIQNTKIKKRENE